MIGQLARGDGGLRAALRGGAWAAAAVLMLPVAAAAQMPEEPRRPTHNLFGMTGLIDTPTAEMQPDGQISFTSAYFDGFLRNTLSAQILPGVEAAFRYSALEDLFDTTIYDRNFDVKFRLVEESPAWPAVALGFQDILGTGIYTAEYLAATKRFLDGDLTVTGGLGWGRLAGANPLDNPFCLAADALCDRVRGVRSLGEIEGGVVEFGSFFAGEDMGVFAGVEWRTPLEDLVVKAEYSDDDYGLEEEQGAFEREFPLNLGLEYRPSGGIDIGAYYMYGAAVGVRLTLSGNPFRPLAPADAEPAPPLFRSRPEPDAAAAVAPFLGETREVVTFGPSGTDLGAAGVTAVAVEERDGVRWASAYVPDAAACPEAAALAVDAEYGVVDAVTFRRPDGRPLCTVALRAPGQRAVQQEIRAAVRHPTGWYDSEARRQEIVEALVAELDPARIGLFGIELAPHRVAVYIENRRFRSMPRAIGRTARALSSAMPPSIELFEIIPVEGSLPVASVMFERSALEDYVERPDAARAAWLSARVDDAAPVDWSEVGGTLDLFPRPYWSLNPVTPFNVFDPDQPFRADLSLIAEGGVELLPGFSVNAAVQKRIVGDLDDIERESDSELPRVRSDFARYLAEGDPGLRRMTVDYVTKLDDAVYGRLSTGLLEWMHGGVSGELLWKPVEQSWGLGLELNYTRQRDFDMAFGFQDYDVATGHASLYWDTGFHGLGLQVDAGRYLAGDWGGTFTLKRRFANGWEMGGFFTLTDVPFEEFGEGSFDKGVILTIPFNWMLPFESRSEYRAVIRPLTRDGGQRLQVANRLYPLVEDVDRGGLRTDWESFWE